MPVNGEEDKRVERRGGEADGASASAILVVDDDPDMRAYIACSYLRPCWPHEETHSLY